MPFEEVPELVANRRVFLLKSNAYVAMNQVHESSGWPLLKKLFVKEVFLTMEGPSIHKIGGIYSCFSFS